MSQFSVAHLKPLVIGRGPVRLEALEVFAEQGMTHMGILLSRKDSYAAPYCQAPELRCLPPQCNVHLVPDYICTDSPQAGCPRERMIQQVLDLCINHGYNAVFAGYGFLAEDPLLSERVQAAGVTFIGPGAHASRQAGAKDAAKIKAAAVGASVVPGFNCLLGCAFVLQVLQSDAVWSLSDDQRLSLWQNLEAAPVKFKATTWEQLLEQAQCWVESELAHGRVQVADDVIAQTAFLCMTELWRDNPGFDLRLKAIHGGGGKGQRVLSQSADATQVTKALQAIWVEAGAAGPLANKNCVIELNIPLIRHWEIQLIGNGEWCLALGGRDCSLQRFEQKLVEFSLTQESLTQQSLTEGVKRNQKESAQDLASLEALEAEAVAFGEAVNLDSVSTYEAIVSMSEGSENSENDQRHFFMEMNTRLQVEHRVSELVYGLEFPVEGEDGNSAPVRVTSLIHLMCVLAVYGKTLPKPQRYTRSPASVEVRINAMNNALKPAVGGLLQFLSAPIEGELRDDQGLSRLNPDTRTSMSYALTGAYDSNLALSVVQGNTRTGVIESMQKTLAAMSVQGREVETNIPVLIGILAVLRHWPTARIATHWILGYLNTAAVVQEYLTEKFSSLNPHRVIAWFLEQDMAILWQGPGGFSTGQLEALNSLCEQAGVRSYAQGLGVAPVPSQAADQILDPPPALDDCIIRAPSGGLYYAQLAPGLPQFVQPGQIVKKGETLCIIEVMKMFNPVLAPIDMIVEELTIENAMSVKKGDALMRFNLEGVS